MVEASNLTGFARGGRCRLPAALAASLAFHGLVMTGAALLDARPGPAPAPPPLQAKLVPPPAPPTPALIAPEAPSTRAAPAASPPPPVTSRPDRKGFQVRDPAAQALRQIAGNLLYPPEAIAAGLEGEALVTLFLDEAGSAVAARVERTSGHAALDEAAVRAARAVRALPEGAPREVLLPVRFRLH